MKMSQLHVQNEYHPWALLKATEKIWGLCIIQITILQQPEELS